MSLIQAFDDPSSMEIFHLLLCRIHNPAKFEAHQDIYKRNFEQQRKRNPHIISWELYQEHSNMAVWREGKDTASHFSLSQEQGILVSGKFLNLPRTQSPDGCKSNGIGHGHVWHKDAEGGRDSVS